MGRRGIKRAAWVLIALLIYSPLSISAEVTEDIGLNRILQKTFPSNQNSSMGFLKNRGVFEAESSLVQEKPELGLGMPILLAENGINNPPHNEPQVHKPVDWNGMLTGGGIGCAIGLCIGGLEAFSPGGADTGGVIVGCSLGGAVVGGFIGWLIEH